MKAGKKKRRALRQTVLKAVSYTALLIAGQLLSVLGGYCCIMRHLSDAVGIPLMTAGFFLIVVFAHRMQEEYDRFISSKYSGRPLYRIKRKREKRAKVFVDLDGVLAKWSTDASVEDTYAPGFFLTREPEPEAIAAVMLMRKEGLDVYILSCAYQNGLAEAEKDAWLAGVGLSDIPRIFVPYGERKSDYVDEADVNVLLDDYSRNLHEWKAEGNIGCKFYNGINGTHGTWDGYSVSSWMTAEQITAVITDIVRKQVCFQAAA